MGRAERRRLERKERIEDRKGKVALSRQELRHLREQVRDDVSGYSVEALMTCFALAERRVHKFGQKRIFKSLQYVEDLMKDIIDDKATIEEYKKQLEDETGIIIKC